MKQRTFYLECWQCGGHGVSGRFLNRNVHITVTCWVCGGRGYKALRRRK